MKQIEEGVVIYSDDLSTLKRFSILTAKSSDQNW